MTAFVAYNLHMPFKKLFSNIHWLLRHQASNHMPLFLSVIYCKTWICCLGWVRWIALKAISQFSDGAIFDGSCANAILTMKSLCKSVLSKWTCFWPRNMRQILYYEMFSYLPNQPRSENEHGFGLYRDILR